MQFPILQYLDVVVGLAAVMIVVATFVTAVTQLVMSSTYARARYLRDGLSVFLVQLDSDKLASHARYLAELALRDESVGGKKLMPWLTRLRNALTRGGGKPAAGTGAGEAASKTLPPLSPATEIQREELVLLLLRLMAKKSEGAMSEACGQLLEAVKGGGTFDPAETLKGIEKAILDQESAHPEWPSSRWRNAAIQELAKTTGELHDLVAKVYAWYDNAMGRISSNFGFEAKVVTVAIAFAACGWLQLDTIALVKRLSTDANYRNAVVAQAQKLGVVSQDPGTQPAAKVGAAAQPTPAAQPASSASAPRTEPTPADLCGGLEAEQCREQVVKKLAEVRELSLLPVKTGTDVPLTQWPWPGIMLSWVLVSLGAPFWYDVLKDVMGLRSSLAQQDEKDRDDRRSQQS